MEPENEKSLKAAATLIKVLLGCFTTSTLILSALPWFGVLKVGSSNVQSNPNFAGLTEIFYVIAIFAAVAGNLLKKFLLKTASKKLQSNSINSRLQIFNMSHVLAFACFEAIAIFGLVNYFLTADRNASLIFGTISIACMILNWPKESQLREFVEEDKGASLMKA